MTEKSSSPGTVVIVDDDPMVATTLSNVLATAGYHVETFTSPHEAIAHLTREPADVVMSDVNMPDLNGLEMVSALRKVRSDVPVVFLTGAPRVEDTVRAIELGAFRYLSKPIDTKQLKNVVHDAVKWGRLTRASSQGPATVDREALESAFVRTLATIRMAYQPIVSVEGRRVFGYEALMRSQEKTLPSPLAVLDAAEKLGSLRTLGRRLRDITAAQAAAAQPFDHTFFVNLHASDLADPSLYDKSSPLSMFAPAVVLEITERASLEGVGEVERRIGTLRDMGFRIAVDDLGAGYAGLSYFARISPDVVKIDMSLIRGIDTDAVKRRIVASICSLAHDLDMLIVAEGIETEAELSCVAELGAELIQGYLIAKPGAYPDKKA